MRRLALLVVPALVLALLGACSTKNALVPNVPPETTIFVQGPVDTVNHVVHLYWFGSDPDGEVRGFDLRFLNPAAPGDTQWVRTVRTDSVFTVFTPAGASAPVFEVRAVDDAGAIDPTPARQAFNFSNQAPVVDITGGPSGADSTFASVTIDWSVSDPDGDAARLQYRVWLDGHEADPHLTTARTFTIPTADFRVSGQLLAGFRTVYVQAVDDGGRAGARDSLTWFVRAPVTGSRARLLIVDDLPFTNPANAATDSIYTNTAARNLPAGTWSLLRLDSDSPFRSTLDVEQTLKLFEAVVWYVGGGNSFAVNPTLLADHQDAVGAYLEAGGRFYVDGLSLVEGRNAPGAFDEDFLTRYLGSDKLHQAFSAGLGDSTAGWGNFGGSVFRSAFGDSLRLVLLPSSPPGAFASGGLRAFAVRDTSYALVWAPPGSLTPANAYRFPVAVSVPQPSGGRAVVVSFPLRGANGYFTVPRFLANVFVQLGLAGP